MTAELKIVEVGPRDGLQNERSPVALEHKVALVNALSKAGFQEIETGSFVSPKWVPQMADSAEVFARIERRPGVSYSALTPNLRGFEAAVQAGVSQVSIFAAASQTFSQKNINCDIDTSIERFVPIAEQAASLNIPVRAYVSCVLGCPYEGNIPHSLVIETAKKLLDLGCFEVSLGDTIGVGTPFQTSALLHEVLQHFPNDKIAMHFHDTYGQALANTMVSYEAGIRCFDASVAGLGGCPYAKGASGNVATEDMLYMFNQSGIDTGIDLDLVIDAGQAICDAIGRPNQSRVAAAKRSGKMS